MLYYKCIQFSCDHMSIFVLKDLILYLYQLVKQLSSTSTYAISETSTARLPEAFFKLAVTEKDLLYMGKRKPAKSTSQSYSNS